MMGRPMTAEEERVIERRRALENYLDEWRKAKTESRRIQMEAYAQHSFTETCRGRVRDAAELLYGREGIEERMEQIDRDYESELFYEKFDHSPKVEAIEESGYVPVAE